MKNIVIRKTKPNYLTNWFSGISENNKNDLKDFIEVDDRLIARLSGEFWSNKQRQANSLHEISYRACFKAQLPNFFIQSLSAPGDIVYDPFNGRGTTVVEAALLGRNVIANDINPLSSILAEPRLLTPNLKSIENRLKSIDIDYSLRADIDLTMFYEARTEAEIVSLKNLFLKNKKNEPIDQWIRMVATNRLTGHSKNFFSVYTMPPNLSVSQKRQIKINESRNQKPQYKDVKSIILKKSAALLKDIGESERRKLSKIAESAIFLNNDASSVCNIKNNSVQLTVTSPPFLNIVQYSDDNWLRNWFNGIDSSKLLITMSKTVFEWSKVMLDVFKELHRITKPGGFVAFEVGEIQKGKIKLDEITIPLGLKAGFESAVILINEQKFTKTANIWGVSNNEKGTNTNRVVIFYKSL